MNYAWARDFALELINQYSVAGDKVALSYNNQADYLARIPKLLDDAQTMVATTVRRIRAAAPLSELTEVDTRHGWRVYKFPTDCWQFASGGLIRFTPHGVRRFHKYRLLSGDRIAVPSGVEDTAELEYFRYPKLLGTNPTDTAELDNTIEVQMALPYYVAAHLVMYDNNFAYGALYNEWEGKLERLYELPQTELNITENVYDAAEWGAQICE